MADDPKLTSLPENEQKLLMHARNLQQNYGINVFALLDIAARYADTLKADNEMLGPGMQLYNEIVALQAKYKPLIDRFQANLPQNQKMIAEALPIIQGQ